MATAVQEKEISPYALHGGKLVCERYEKSKRGFLFRKKTIRLSQEELDELSREYTLKLIEISKLTHDSMYASWALVREISAIKGSFWSLHLVNGLGETVIRTPIRSWHASASCFDAPPPRVIV